MKIFLFTISFYKCSNFELLYDISKSWDLQDVEKYVKHTFEKKKKLMQNTWVCDFSFFFQKSYKNMVSNTIFYIMNG